MALTLTYSITIECLDFGVAFGGTATTVDTSDDVISLHIHNGCFAATGSVVFNLQTQDSNNSVTTLNSDGTATICGVWDATDASAQPLSNFRVVLAGAIPGQNVAFYFNIHTVGAPSSEIRGQFLHPQMTPTMW